MPKIFNSKQILMACRIAFDGKSNHDFAKPMGSSEVTVSSWRKTELWQEFESELVEAYKDACKEQVLADFAPPP